MSLSACPEWPPLAGGWTGNLPDNIARAAARLGLTVANGRIVNVSSTSGYSAGYTTCQ